MIEGVTILSQETIQVTEGNTNLAFLWGGIFFLVCVILGVIISFCDHDPTWAAISALLGIMIMIIVAVVVYDITIAPTGETYEVYKVTVDENVSFQEFYNTYEIIDKDGLIYTIKELK